MRTLLIAALAFLAVVPALAHKTENVILVTYDGLRWQELFGGADETLLDEEHGGVRDVAALRQRFWRGGPIERRKALLPFFWSVVAERGRIYGNPDADSRVTVTNGRVFSYPGYNEILAGVADDRIISNAKKPNANLTVLGWLHQQPGFAGKVAAFASWDVFPYIIDEPGTGVYVNAGWEPLERPLDSERQALMAEIQRDLPHYWGAGVRYDAFTLDGALARLASHRPRVLYVAFDETDDWAHGGRYDLYLDAAHRTDDFVHRLWSAVESDSHYAGKTSLVLTTDHGRGGGLDDWKSHGADVDGAKRIWIAVMGPDTPASGSVNGAQATQAQVAATVAALLGLDFVAASPSAAPPLPGIR
ncbi:MAG: AP protein [Acidobacteriota bacterium]|nr:AP protein [Acidobacteriota bacterium]